MSGKKLWLIWVVICIAIAISKLYKPTEIKSTDGKTSQRFSVMEQASKELNAIEQFKAECNKLNSLRQPTCLNKENEFLACLRTENFQWVHQYETAVNQCLRAHASEAQ